MMEQWGMAIRHRNKLWKKFKRNRTDAIKLRGIQNNTLQGKQQTPKTRANWSTFLPFFHTKSEQANDIILKENNRIISDKKEIANLLNDYFDHIADSMPEILSGGLR